MKTNKPATKLTLNKDTLKNLAVKTGVNAGGYGLNGKLSAQSFCAGCQSVTVPSPM